ncbi:hypothetical protein ABW20_dc0108783 [Dactylellina cionopaga]|nr:hypothetical protein ABW20_dc0108783 [Dactylellina cionopaga]
MISTGAYTPLPIEDEDNPASTIVEEIGTVAEVFKDPAVPTNATENAAAETIDITWRATTWCTTFFYPLPISLALHRFHGQFRSLGKYQLPY